MKLHRGYDWELSTFNLSRFFIFCQSKTACINGSRTKNPCFKSAIYHLMYKYKKTPQITPIFDPKTPFFCLNFVLQKYCILHWFFMLIFRHTVTGFFDSLESVTQPSCNFLTPLNHIVTKSPYVVTTETVVTTFHPMGQNGIGASVPNHFDTLVVGCCAWTP